MKKVIFSEGVSLMKNSKGYTLVELLAVIVIMAILAGIAVPLYFHFMMGTEGICVKLTVWRWPGCMTNI